MLSSAIFSLRTKPLSLGTPRHSSSPLAHHSCKHARPGSRSTAHTISRTSSSFKIPILSVAQGSAITRRFCASNATDAAPKSRFSLFQWKDDTITRLKAKKAQFLVEYGSTFIFLHEFLGIASFGTCFAIASAGLVTLEDIVNFIAHFFGGVPDSIQQVIENKRGSLASTALTALVLLKCLDWLGLTPFRWFLALTLTPRIAWWLGPRIDSVVASIKSKLPKRKAIAEVPAEIIQPVHGVQPIVSDAEKTKSL